MLDKVLRFIVSMVIGMAVGHLLVILIKGVLG